MSRMALVGLACLFTAGCSVKEVENREASDAIMDTTSQGGAEASICSSCHVFTEVKIEGEDYTCWIESQNDQKEDIFNISTADNPIRFLIPKGRWCVKEMTNTNCTHQER